MASGEGGPTCIDCHGTHTIVSEHKLPINLQENCFKCHSDIEKQFRTSVHADIQENRALSHCYDCHGEHRSRAPSDTTLHVVNESPAEATCGACHEESVARYNKSLHAHALERGSPRAPRCESCHGSHNIYRVNDPRSPVSRSQEIKTCSGCHSKMSLAEDPDIRLPLSFENYMQSTHGKLLAKGDQNVPMCTDCHGGHSILPSSNPKSTIAPLNVDKTCGQCHPGEAEEYRTSIHYRALKFGIQDSPTCTGCHGEHSTLSPNDPMSSVSHLNEAKESCGKCHNNPAIIRKYGLSPDAVSTYLDSYHGLAIQRGDKKTATCSDCHLAHGIRTQRDSLSTIYPANVKKTCQKCHPKADEKFATAYTHKALQMHSGGITWWITRIYWVAILLIIGGMILHNLIIMNFYMMESKRRQELGEKIERFDIHALIQHIGLSFSFIMLAITGFALKYPNAWWVKLLSLIGLTEAVRRPLHRVMATMLIAVSIYHVIYLFFTKKGRIEWKALLPEKSDFTDLITTIKYYLRLSDRPPEYGRFDYMQKAEYWALIWGMLVMMITGFVLWFPSQLLPLLPRWAINVAQVVHLYEAWLATLAIVVWHFFFVVFHPEEYPMSWTWLTGKISEESVRHHHSRWWKQLKEKKAIKSESKES